MFNLLWSGRKMLPGYHLLVLKLEMECSSFSSTTPRVQTIIFNMDHSIQGIQCVYMTVVLLENSTCSWSSDLVFGNPFMQICFPFTDQYIFLECISTFICSVVAWSSTVSIIHLPNVLFPFINWKLNAMKLLAVARYLKTETTPQNSSCICFCRMITLFLIVNLCNKKTKIHGS